MRIEIEITPEEIRKIPPNIDIGYWLETVKQIIMTLQENIKTYGTRRP